MSCRREFYLRAAKPQANQEPDDVFVTSPLGLTSNSAGLQNLSCHSGVAVPVRLLAIEESVDCDVGVCEYNSPHYNGKDCIFSHNQFAHLYIGTEIDDASVKHYIIAFVESTKIDKIDNYKELVEILCRTVNWLNIEKESPYFYIYYHGKQPVFDAGLNNARNYITRGLKLHLGNYEGKAFCQTRRVRTDVTNFTIYDSNPYQCTMS
jgi:hypothetical protein